MINKKQCTIEKSWQNFFILIIDQISIVSLKLLSTIDFQINQLKEKKINNIAMLNSLALEIIIRDFYQFLSIVRKSL